MRRLTDGDKDSTDLLRSRGASKGVLAKASLSRKRYDALTAALRRLRVSVWRIEKPSDCKSQSHVASNGLNLVFTDLDHIIRAFRDAFSETKAVPDDFMQELKKHHDKFKQVIRGQIRILDPKAADREMVRVYFTNMMNRFDLAVHNLQSILNSPEYAFNALDLLIKKGEEMRVKQRAMELSIEKQGPLYLSDGGQSASPVLRIENQPVSRPALTDQESEGALVKFNDECEEVAAVMSIHYDPACLAEAQRLQSYSKESIFSAHGSFERDVLKLRSKVSHYLKSPYRSRPNVLERFLSSVLSRFETVIGHFYVYDDVAGKQAGELAKKNVKMLAADSLTRFSMEVSKYLTAESASESLKGKLYRLVQLMQTVGIEIQLHQEITDGGEQIKVLCLSDGEAKVDGVEAQVGPSLLLEDAFSVEETQASADSDDDDDDMDMPNLKVASADVQENVETGGEAQVTAEEGVPATTVTVEDGVPATTVTVEDGVPATTVTAEEGVPATTVTVEEDVSHLDLEEQEERDDLEKCVASILAGVRNSSMPIDSSAVPALKKRSKGDRNAQPAESSSSSSSSESPSKVKHSLTWAGSTFAVTSAALAAVCVPLGFYAPAFSQFLGSFSGGVGGFIAVLAAVALAAGCVAGVIASRQGSAKKGSWRFLDGRSKDAHGLGLKLDVELGSGS